MSDWEWPEEVLETSRREAERKKLSSRLSRVWNNGHKIFFTVISKSSRGQLPFNPILLWR